MSSIGQQFAMRCPDCGAGMSFHPGAGMRCQNGHVHADMDALLARKPQTVATAVAKPLPPGWTALQVHMPPDMANAAIQRFGARLDESLRSMVGVMLDPEAFVVLGQHVQEIGAKTNQKPKNAQQLLGLLFAMKQELAETKGELEKLRESRKQTSAYGSMSGDEVTIKPDQQVLAAVKAKADKLNKTVPKFITEFLEFAVKQGWIRV